MDATRPPVDWRTRHEVLANLSSQVTALARPDSEWLDTPAAAAAPTKAQKGMTPQRASVEEALRQLSDTRVKMKGVRYTVYEPKTLRLRGDDRLGGGAASPSAAAVDQSPTLNLLGREGRAWEERTIKPAFVELKAARTPRAPKPSALVGLSNMAEVDEQWRKVQLQHLERKEAAAMRYAPSPAQQPLAQTYSGSSSPRTLLRSTSALSPATGRGGISGVAAQVSLAGVGAHYNYSPKHAAEVEERRRLHEASAARGGSIGQLSYTPSRDLAGFALSPRTGMPSPSAPLRPGYAIPKGPSLLHSPKDRAALLSEGTPPLLKAKEPLLQLEPRRQPEPEPEPEPEPPAPAVLLMPVRQPEPEPEPESPSYSSAYASSPGASAYTRASPQQQQQQQQQQLSLAATSPSAPPRVSSTSSSGAGGVNARADHQLSQGLYKDSLAQGATQEREARRHAADERDRIDEAEQEERRNKRAQTRAAVADAVLAGSPVGSPVGETSAGGTRKSRFSELHDLLG